MPRITKSALRNIEKHEKDMHDDKKQQYMKQAEADIQKWVTVYIDEINRIENFYASKLKELKREFNLLKRQYH